MITTHIQPSVEDRQTSREALCKLLAAQLFSEWLQEQTQAGHIPATATEAAALATQQES